MSKDTPEVAAFARINLYVKIDDAWSDPIPGVGGSMFVDNQKLQVKAEKAKDVVNIDTARKIKQLKELLKECRRPVCWYVDIFKNKAELLTKIDEALR